MVMSTTEQQTFETALVTPTSLDTIKAGLSKVDVRQVRALPSAVSSPVSMPIADKSLSCTRAALLSDSIGRRSAATSRTRTPSCSSSSKAWAPSSATGWWSA